MSGNIENQRYIEMVHSFQYASIRTFSNNEILVVFPRINIRLALAKQIQRISS